MRRLLLAVLAAMGLAVVGTVVAVASIPDTSGTIHACYLKTGELRVIDSSTASCAKKETALNWSQTGPQGPPGAQGATGPAGAAGPPGAPGVSGYEVVSYTESSQTGFHISASVTCPDGKQAIAGGARALDPSGALRGSYPAGQGATGGAWEANLTTSSPPGLTVWAICANVTP